MDKKVQDEILKVNAEENLKEINAPVLQSHEMKEFLRAFKVPQTEKLTK